MTRVSLIVPGLHVGFDEVEFPVSLTDYPALAVLLSRGAHTMLTDDAEQVLLQRMGYAAPRGQALALAAATARIDLPAEHSSAQLWRCDPVCLRADPAHLLLFDSRNFQLTAIEADALIALLNEEIPELGLRRGVDPLRWYAAPAGLAPLAIPSPRALNGRPITTALPAGPSARTLRRLLNDAQMTLHEIPSNERRAAAGLLPVNGMWLWGAGEAPVPVADGPCTIFGDDVLAAGLAAHGDRSWQPQARVETVLAALRDGEVLVVLGAPFGRCRGDAALGALAELEQGWLQPLLRALWRLRYAELELVTARWSFVLNRRGLLRLWRKPQSATVLYFSPHVSV